MQLARCLCFATVLPLAQSLATVPFLHPIPERRQTSLQHDVGKANETVHITNVKLRKMELDLPAADPKDPAGSLPVYVHNDIADQKHPLVQRRVLHNFTGKEVTQMAYSRSHGLTNASAGGCTPFNTIFDMGFYDGADSRAYLAGGYCVVGIEADPDLIATALQDFAVWVATGQLQLTNVAIAPQKDTNAWTVFYRNRCSKEWNSFIKTVGCRSCQPPHAVDENACEMVKVTSTDCASIFNYFGVPHYLKLDIEGAEPGCFEAMKSLPQGVSIPHYASAEVTQLEYIDTLYALGYRGFKLVRQDRLASAAGSTTGPWGENALDCATGVWWRDYAAVRQEFQTILSKDLNPADPCPGGVMPIHGSPKMAAAYMWYDLHATVTAPAR